MTFLGRFDEAVIEERRLSSMKLMNFVVQFPLMIQHSAFQVFVKVFIYILLLL